MSRDVEIRPLTAVVIVVLFVVLLGGRFWAYGQSVSIAGFSYLHNHPGGDTVALLDGSLYRFTASDELVDETDLNKLGVARGQITDFAWFSDGDILIRQGRRDEGLLLNLDRYRRKTNTAEEYAENSNSRLVRCDTATAQCKPFTSTPLNLNDVFALEIDVNTDKVFIADTSRHKVYLYSPDGHEIDRIDSKLKFPNQLSFENDSLYIANTNRHEISVYKVGESGFEGMADPIAVTPEEAITSGRKWPAAFLFQEEKLWVINASNRMDHGGIFLFDKSDDNTYLYQADEPDEADPVALVQHGDRILVSDFSHDRIDVYKQDGTHIGEFLPAWLEQHVLEIRQQRTDYQLLTDVLTWLFIASLAGGFIYALVRQFRPSSGVSQQHEADPVVMVNPADPAIHWVQPDKKTRRTLYLLPLIIVVLLVVLLFLQSLLGKPGPGIDSPMLAAMAALAVLLFAGIFNSLGKRIGVLGDVLILRDRKGNYSAGKGKQIQYSDAAILIGRQFVVLGAQPKIFPTDLMVEHVYPVLKDAEYVTQGKMQRLLLSKSKAFLFAMIILFGALIGVLVYLML